MGVIDCRDAEEDGNEIIRGQRDNNQSPPNSENERVPGFEYVNYDQNLQNEIDIAQNMDNNVTVLRSKKPKKAKEEENLILYHGKKENTVYTFNQRDFKNNTEMDFGNEPAPRDTTRLKTIDNTNINQNLVQNINHSKTQTKLPKSTRITKLQTKPIINTNLKSNFQNFKTNSGSLQRGTYSFNNAPGTNISASFTNTKKKEINNLSRDKDRTINSTSSQKKAKVFKLLRGTMNGNDMERISRSYQSNEDNNENNFNNDYDINLYNAHYLKSKGITYVPNNYKPVKQKNTLYKEKTSYLKKNKNIYYNEPEYIAQFNVYNFKPQQLPSEKNKLETQSLRNTNQRLTKNSVGGTFRNTASSRKEKVYEVETCIDDIISLDPIQNRKNTDKQKTSPSDEFSKEVMNKINQIRVNPSSFIEKLVEGKKQVKEKNGKLFYDGGMGKKVALNRGEEAFNEAIEDLRNMKKMPALIFWDKIAIEQPSKEEDINNKDYLKNQIEKLTAEGLILRSYWKEIIDDPEICTLLMIADDNTKGQKQKRKDLLNKDIKYIGISSGNNTKNGFQSFVTLSKEK